MKYIALLLLLMGCGKEVPYNPGQQPLFTPLTQSCSVANYPPGLTDVVSYTYAGTCCPDNNPKCICTTLRNPMPDGHYGYVVTCE